MANCKKMTSADAAEFLHQVERRGKALSLPPDQLEKYRDEYDKIVVYLKENYMSFLKYHISSGSNMVNMDTFNRAIKVMESRGIFGKAKAAIQKGDAKELEKQCKQMRSCYNETVNQLLWEAKHSSKR